LRHVSLKANRYKLVSSEAAGSDVTAIIFLPVSHNVAFKQVEAAWYIWVAMFHILVQTQLVLTEAFHESLQSPNHMTKQCLTRCQAIPFSSIFADHPANSFYINQTTA
jgi:hypothetical protein